MQSDYFTLLTSEVMHYFYISKKISELLFQTSKAHYFLFPFIDWQLSCPGVERSVSKHRSVSFSRRIILFTFGVKGPLQEPKI